MDSNVTTDSREALPKTLSYPVTASEVVAALEDLDVEEGIKIVFRTSPLRTNEYRKLYQAGLPLPAMAAVFVNWPDWKPPASKSRHPSPLRREWRVEVYGVPREHRNHMHKAASGAGLSAVREWLQRHRPEAWYQNPGDRRWGKRCTVSVAQLTEEVSIIEYE